MLYKQYCVKSMKCPAVIIVQVLQYKFVETEYKNPVRVNQCISPTTLGLLVAQESLGNQADYGGSLVNQISKSRLKC